MLAECLLVLDRQKPLFYIFVFSWEAKAMLRRTTFLSTLVLFAAVGFAPLAVGSSGVVSSSLFSKLLVRGVLAGENRGRGWVHRRHVVINNDGVGIITLSGVVRTRTFKDALSRPALAITKERSDAEEFLLIWLKSPSSGERGNNARWTMRDIKADANHVKAKFLWKGEVYDKLPEEFVIRPVSSVDKIKKKEKFWVSMTELLADNGDELLLKKTPLFKERFSDEVGRAAQLTLTDEGKLRLKTDGATFGLWPDQKLPETISRANCRKIELFEDHGAETSWLPIRLNREPLFQCDNLTELNFPDGVDVYVSARYLYVILFFGGQLKEESPRYAFFGCNALASIYPFTDEFGEAFCLKLKKRGSSFGSYQEPSRPWVLPAFADWQNDSPIEGIYE